MFLFKKEEDLRKFITQKKSENKAIGFVPTMGALHKGHLALVHRSADENDFTVVSIFVNPTQFNDKHDLEKYPRPIEEDIRLLTEGGDCEVLFMPSEEDMYPKGAKIGETFSLGILENIFEGKYRPGHFQGVAHIVYKLLTTVHPTRLYMGQKDYQQCLVVKKLIADRKLPAELVTVPTKREVDGLAMSSRNRLLTPTQRALAGLIYQCLVSIQAQKNQKNFSTVQKECIDLLQKKGLKPDYIALADAETLSPLEDYSSEKPTVALIAATVGQTRLIDNLIL